MTLDRFDLVRMRWELGLIVGAAALCVGFVLAGQDQLAGARREHAAANARKTEFEGKLKQVRQEEIEIRRKSELYSDLQRRGVIGTESRLDWIEGIRAIRDNRKLIELKYEFAPQRPLDKAEEGSHRFHSSTMRARLRLLHEGDLVNFINDLGLQSRALIKVDACTIRRSTRAQSGSELAPLTAECDIQWITVMPAGSKS
jgi:hypothetical protein